MTDQAAYNQREGDAVVHPGAVIFVQACKICTFYGPDHNGQGECPACGGTEWWRVEAMVQRVK